MAQEPRKLSKTAYEPEPGQTYTPYTFGQKLPEFTIKSIIVGAILGMVFGAANTYLGLVSGLTISTSIPVAVLSVVVFRALAAAGTKNSILEANMSQTIGSASSSVASGVLFTLPALFIWNMDPQWRQMTLLALCGGFLGILAMIPLRRFLIKKEHGNLPYPEGMACAEVLVAAENGGKQASGVFWGIGLGILTKILTSGLKIIPGTLEFSLGLKAKLAVKVSPALIGVGYILGLRVATIMVSGALLSALILIPGIYLWGSDLTVPFYPETDALIRDMSAGDIWNRYIRYIGAGAVATGGIITLLQSIPAMIESFKIGLKHLGKAAGIDQEQDRTDMDLSFKIAGGIALCILLILALVPGVLGYIDSVPIRIVAALLVAIFAFFFVTVSSRIVGLVGVTSNPTSGMTIATLIVASLVFLAFGWTDELGKASALMVGTVVCIAASIAGDTSQDLKTGFILGATPKRQQIGELVGVLTSAGVVCFVLILLDQSQELGSAALPAPQATLMKLVIDGVLSQQLPWNLVAIGAGLALVVWIFRIPPLPFAVGVYLPLSTMAPVFLGGLLRYLMVRKQKPAEKERRREKGVLLGSGMVGGEGLTGVLFALWIVIQGGGKIAGVNLSFPGWVAIAVAALGLLAFMDIFRTFIRHNNQPAEGEKADKVAWKRPAVLLLLAIVLALVFGEVKKKPVTQISQVTVVHMNDVYETMPQGDDTGGLARVATLREDLLTENPNVLTVMAGDLVSPSAIGLAQVDGKPIAGAQMIATMNALGLDIMTFGNHEFDIDESQIRDRVAESKFTWTTANITESADGTPFANAQPYVVKTFDQGQTPLKVGIFSLTLDSNPQDYLRYDTNYAEVARSVIETLRSEEQVHVIIALTHLSLEDDRALAAAVPEIDMVLGGHEHENMYHHAGVDQTPIAKADANARTVYIHTIHYDHTTDAVSVDANLKTIDGTIADDPDTAAVAEKWQDIAYESYREQGFEPEAVVAIPTEDLDGLESSVRNNATRLTELIAEGMKADFDQADAAVYNSGSIRIDDVLAANQAIRQYDILRILPFGGNVQLIEMRGDVVTQMLNAGVDNRGTGGYLQTDGIGGEKNAWTINGEPIDSEKTYQIVLSEYLAAGKETNLAFIGPDNPGVEAVAVGSDIRGTLANALVTTYGEAN